MPEIQHYVLFPNHDNAMRLHRDLKKIGVRATIAPTPRAASTCCGVSLLIQEEEVRKVEVCVKEQGIDILRSQRLRRM